MFFFPEITPIATSKMPEKLAPSRQDIYQGKLVNSVRRQIQDQYDAIRRICSPSYSDLPCLSSLLDDRTTGSHPRVPGSWPALQVLRAGAADGGWDGICGALHQTHVHQAHGVPVRLHKHSEWPAPAEGTSWEGDLELGFCFINLSRPQVLKIVPRI